MRALLASPLGFLIGVSLGALGGGGSILAVPALVYAAGQSPKQATTTSLVLVTITALTGIVPHWRAGRVRLVAGMVFGAAGVGGSLLGSSWNKSADPNVLLLAFSGVMLVAASAMWRRSARSAEPAAGQRPTVVSASTVIKVVVAGTGVGLLTGFFGVGGGFVIVPALVLALGFDMPRRRRHLTARHRHQLACGLVQPAARRVGRVADGDPLHHRQPGRCGRG
ncbi:MAG: sulfite exporter TauE/SafE family protein [Ilumatobacteraceae bacterium]